MIAAFDATVRRIGPERVGYVSFTRTAAEEARQRAAQSLGLRHTNLKAKLPHVGTIHSLCYRLLGVSTLQMVNRSRLAEFADLFDASAPKSGFEYVPEELDAPYMLVEGKDDLAGMQLLASTAAHRMISLEEALEVIPQEYVDQIGPERLVLLAQQYARWKKERNYLDFDDLLVMGANVELPVSCLIADEVQDNSPLLWHVIDRWSRKIRLVICAGDPFQSIYIFNGADPSLFLRRPGRWVHLDVTHRFGQEGTEYARRVLRTAFNTDEMQGLDAWQGVGGEARDQTRLCLARTNNLLKFFEAEFQRDGTPYARRGRKSPLEKPEADAYRTGLLLQQGEVVPASKLLALAQSGLKSNMRPIKALGDKEVDRTEAEVILGRPLAYVMDYLPYADYFERIVRRYGPGGMLEPPKTTLSTIHGAKGREADEVTLLESWGYIPGRALSDPQARRAETCVAYVGSTRHRTKLEVWPYGDGIPFLFPG